MAAQPVAYSGDGRGPSGPAQATAQPRPQPLSQRVQGTRDGPDAHVLREAWSAYNGRFNGDQDDASLAPQTDVPDLNVRSNRLRAIVNTGVDFLFGPELTISTKDEEAQAIIDAAWGDSDLRMTLLSKAGINGGVYGHVFFKVVEPKVKRGKKGTAGSSGSSGSGGTAASALNPPRLVLLNPELLTIETDPDDADLVARFSIEYATTAADGSPLRKRQTITRLDPDDDDDTVASGIDSDTSWLIQDWEATGMSGQIFRPVGPARTWAYELPPIVDWQNFPNPNTHWGQPDISAGLIALSRQLRLVESNINKIGYVQGFPYFYSTGADTNGIKPTPGRIIDLGAPDADLKAVSGAGDLAQLMAFADQLRSDMDEESGIPGVALGRMKDMPRGQISGVSMRLLHSSALARTEHKRRLYGQGIIQICQTVLCLCGWDLARAQALDIELGWQDPLPNDDLNQAQAAVALQGIGYSQHTLIERTGGTPETEAQWKQEEQQQQVAAFSQGQGMPPEPPPAAAEQQQDEPDGNEASTQQQPPLPPGGANGSQRSGKSGKGNGGQVPPVNHPAAIAAQQKAAVVMKAAFGKR